MKTSTNFLCLLIILLINFVESNNSACNSNLYGTGVCTHYKYCNFLSEKLRNKEIQLKDVVYCGSYSLVCCPSSAPSSPENFVPQELKVKLRISEEKCIEYAESTKQINYVSQSLLSTKPIKVVVDKCNHKSVPLVVGGTEAQSHEFPHHAVLGRGKESSIEWSCGGSLVSPQFILTAAHCAPVATFVKIGINSLSRSNDQKLYRVIQKIVHPKYNSGLISNDIALLKLNQNVELNENVHPICLPTKQFDEPKAIATGFGKTSFYDTISNKLLKVTLEKFSIRECQETFDDKTIDDKSMLCYGHRTEAKDTCDGDSGGPLQVSNGDQVKCTYMQIGIVSFGSRYCGSEGVPAIYVNVFNYIDWIEQVVWKNGS
ncbi:venom protease-like [Chironomus tepperi]|uniref:venom protease-like n=1 Tax=Chironomus tepperi TaxID=113505 RepID=UPI00391F241C